MVRYAKNSEKLYADMRSLYEDTDFPGWWYSPARNANGAPPSSTEIGAAPPSKTDVGAGNGELRAPDPTVDPSIGRRSQRPPLPLRSDPLRSAAPSSAELRGAPPGSAPSAFTDAEINLLASSDIYRSPDSGAWSHREEFQTAGR